jgi:acetyl-CoA carboxylase alpha subunit
VAALKITPPDLLRLGIMDAIVPEPAEGAHADPAGAAANLKTAVLSCRHELLAVDGAALVDARYERFRAFGSPGQASLDRQENA